VLQVEAVAAPLVLMLDHLETGGQVGQAVHLARQVVHGGRAARRAGRRRRGRVRATPLDVVGRDAVSYVVDVPANAMDFISLDIENV